jgi:hypothetical protein
MFTCSQHISTNLHIQATNLGKKQIIELLSDVGVVVYHNSSL